MDTLTDSLKKLLVRGIFMGMFAILLFRAVGTTNLRVKHSITQTLTEHWNGSK